MWETEQHFNGFESISPFKEKNIAEMLKMFVLVMFATQTLLSARPLLLDLNPTRTKDPVLGFVLM